MQSRQVGAVMPGESLHIGSLAAVPALGRPDLLAPAVLGALDEMSDLAGEVGVAEIDPQFADTATFCERYGVGSHVSANCVVVAGRREGETRYAACLLLATTRAAVNTVVRRHLDVRKLSFAPMDEAVRLTSMEYGGITPIGLPDDWQVLVDPAVVGAGRVVIGSGLRRSKLTVPGSLLAMLPAAFELEGLGVPVGEVRFR
jgi:prolyl-tRNA editing enzyme YbaK/EbsC (Cys-tRNA(Pro) deacylase)